MSGCTTEPATRTEDGQAPERVEAGQGTSDLFDFYISDNDCSPLHCNCKTVLHL